MLRIAPRRIRGLSSTGVATMTDPDAGSNWLFFGPVNAPIYGAVGYTLWLFLVGDDDKSAASKKERSDRAARSLTRG